MSHKNESVMKHYLQSYLFVVSSKNEGKFPSNTNNLISCTWRKWWR